MSVYWYRCVIYKTQENKYVPTSLRLRNAISEESHIHTVEKTDRIFKTPDEYRVYRQKKKIKKKQTLGNVID